MSASSLQDLLSIFSKAGELVRVSTEVDPDLELSAVVDRACQQDGPAILFEQVKGQAMPVVANLLGSTRRVNLALGIDSVDDFLTRLEQFTEVPSQKSWLGSLKKNRSPVMPLEKFTPKTVKTGPVQQVVKLGRDVDLTRVPALRSWPEEKTHGIHAGEILTVDPESAQAAMTDSPLVVLGRALLGIPWHPYLMQWEQAESARLRGEKLPVAVVLGGASVLRVMSQLTMFRELNLLTLAGAWQESALNVVRCRTQPLDVPAEAEVILEGYLDPSAETQPLPTFVSPAGGYVQSFPGRVIHVTAITHRSQAVWPAVVYSPQANERSHLNPLAEALLLPELQSHAPEIVNLSIPKQGNAEQFVFVAIKKPYPAAARRVANVIWGHPALMHTKTIVLVDETIDCTNQAALWQQVAAHVDPERDVFMQQGPANPFDVAAGADFAGENLTGGGKMGIDATWKTSAATGSQPLPGIPRPGSETLAQLARCWEAYGITPTGAKSSKKAKV